MEKSEELKNELAARLRESYAEHKHILEHGCNDPFYEDGVNLNLVRNHILYYKRQCKEKLPPEDFPAEYFLETPGEVDIRYMSDPEGIRKGAREALHAYEADKDYQFLKRTVNGLTEKQGIDTSVYRVLSYVPCLRDCIEKDNLVEMRRHCSRYAIDSFRECRKKVEDILATEKVEPVLPEGQLSLFDLFGLTMIGS